MKYLLLIILLFLCNGCSDNPYIRCLDEKYEDSFILENGKVLSVKYTKGLSGYKAQSLNNCIAIWD